MSSNIELEIRSQTLGPLPSIKTVGLLLQSK